MLPIDDDDWFAPNIGQRLEAAISPGSSGAYWLRSWLERPTSIRHAIHLVERRLVPSTPYWVLAANNHGFVKGAVPQEMFVNHVRASKWLTADPGARNLTHIPERLSLANRTLGSHSALTRGMSRKGAVSRRATLVWKYLRYRRYYRRRPAPGLEWVAPYMAQMDGLMNEIALR